MIPPFPFPRPSSQIWPDSQKGKRRRRTFGKQQAKGEEGHECCSNTTFPRKKLFWKSFFSSHFLGKTHVCFFLRRAMNFNILSNHRFALSKKFKVATFGEGRHVVRGWAGGGTWKHPTEFGSRAKHPWKRNIQNWEKGRASKADGHHQGSEKGLNMLQTAVCFSKALVWKIFRVQEKMLLFLAHSIVVCKSFPPFLQKKGFSRERESLRRN